jgi:hypothetical protein
MLYYYFNRNGGKYLIYVTPRRKRREYNLGALIFIRVMSVRPHGTRLPLNGF